MIGTAPQSPSSAMTESKRAIRGLLMSHGVRNDFLGKLIPRDQIESYVAAVLAGIWLKPELVEADAKSIVSAVIQCAQLGLAPCTRDEHAHLVIYRNKGVATLTLVIGFKGLIKCANRAGFRVNANVIRENDRFDLSYGFADEIIHKVDITKPRGEMIAVYVAISRGDERHVSIMTAQEIEEHRDKFSQGVRYKDGNINTKSPWFSHFEAMALKTVIKKGLRRLDLSTGWASNPLQDAIRVDGASMAKYTPEDVLQGMVDANTLDGELIEEDAPISATASATVTPRPAQTNTQTPSNVAPVNTPTNPWPNLLGKEVKVVCVDGATFFGKFAEFHFDPTEIRLEIDGQSPRIFPVEGISKMFSSAQHVAQKGGLE